jgi:site-specific recombinase XerD
MSGGPWWSTVASSCPYCLSWGTRTRRPMCDACMTWRVWQRQRCAGCDRDVPTKKGYCRLCTHQAALQLGQQRIRGPIPAEVRFTGWQLFFTGMRTGRVATTRLRRKPAPPTDPPLAEVRGQLAVLSCRHDFTRFDRTRLTNPDNPTLIAARQLARQRGEARGWSRWLMQEVDEALVILLSQHVPGDRLTFTEIIPIDRLGANVTRTAEVLTELDLLIDDRRDHLDAWLADKLNLLAPGIADEVHRWTDAMRTGSGRTKPRAAQTIRNYVRAALPHLVAWSTRYDHLREITGDDVREIANEFRGLQRKRALVALRSLFGFAHRHRRIFGNPTAGIRTPVDPGRLPQPLQPEHLNRAAQMVMTPTRRLLLALAAIHAARTIHLAALLLTDIDAPNRRINIGGNTRPLDKVTHRALTDYLRHRERRWPHTANPHLLLTERTAHDHRPVSNYWLRSQFRDVDITLNQLRIDRQLEEALVHGPDPLHLAAVFGIAENTAIRYARAAQQLLESPVEGER